MKNIYIVIEQFIDWDFENERPHVYTFSTREKALAYAQERIDYFIDLDTSHNGFSLDYCQGVLYIPWVIDISTTESQIDIMETNTKPCLTPNCLARKNVYILTN